MTLTLEGLAAALTYRNVLACLACIKSSESVLADDDRAYRMLFGGALVDDLSRHPRRAIQSPWGWTSAAGAYQAMAATADGKVRTDTWGDFCRAMGTTADEMPFDAAHQDLFAVWCIRRRGALQDAIAGRFDAVVEKCSYEWASWPPGRYGQPTTTLEKLRAVYVSQGGTFADQAPDTQPAAPIVDHSPDPSAMPAQQEHPTMPIAALIAAFGPMIVEMIPTIAKLFDRTAETPAKVDAVTKVFDTIVKATGTANVQAAVEKMQADPAALIEAKNAVVTEPTIQGLLEIGGGIDAARKANLEVQNAEKSFLHNPAFWITLLLMVAPGLLLADCFYVHPDAYNAELRTQIVTSVLGIILVVCGYWLGTSAGSVRKTDMINQARAP